MTTDTTPEDGPVLAEGVDDEPVEGNRRLFGGSTYYAIAGLSALYALFHMAALNGWSIEGWTGVEIPFLPVFPMETWNFRIVHVAGALILGYILYSARAFPAEERAGRHPLDLLAWAALLPALYACWTGISFAVDIAGGVMWNGLNKGIRAAEIWHYGVPLLIATTLGIVLGWLRPRVRGVIAPADVVLGVCAVGVAIYLITIYGTLMRNATGTPFAPIGMSIAAVAGTALIMELTRRVAGLALIVIAGVFLTYVFVGDKLPGFLNAPDITWQRFFSQVYTDAGILGPTTAVSSNVVATGSLTIPLMKKVGYRPTTAGAVEAAASTGGQIMPPIMGAGAFIMAEITGIPYTDIAIAAIIPAVLYFASIYLMVDFEAAKLGMRGMREDELPKFRDMVRRVFLFLPIVILIVALFMGYSVIRAGTLATASAAIVSWLTPYRMGPRSVVKAFELAGTMSIQIIAVCACAGIIVGVISLTGVGARFSSVLLNIADANQLLALFLLRGRLGHHAPGGAGQLCGGGDFGGEPDVHLGRIVQDRDFRVHRAVHVLLQFGPADGWHGAANRAGGRDGHRGCVLPVLGSAGVVHGRAQRAGRAHPDPDRGVLHDRGGADLRPDRAGLRGGGVPAATRTQNGGGSGLGQSH